MPISKRARRWSLGLFLIPFIAFWILFSVLAQGRPGSIAAITVFLGLTVFAGLQPLRPFSGREVLEIDSRFVTIARDETVLAVLRRPQITDLRLNDVEIPRWLSKMPWIHDSWPKLVWGGNIGGDVDYTGGVAAGVSLDAAARIFEEIAAFCAENPVDDEFDYAAVSLPFSSYPSRKGAPSA